LIEHIARRLGLSPTFRVSSELSTEGAGDDRLIEVVRAVSPGAVYLSGVGGRKYQDPDKFVAAGLGFEYSSFAHPSYTQWGADFVPGLSILDALFHVGWEAN